MSSDATGASSEERTAADLAAGVQARAEDLAAETSAMAEGLAEETDAKADALAIETAAKALVLATQLAETLKAIGERLEEYSVYGRRSRRIIVALAVSFTLDIILTVVVTVLTIGSISQNSQLHASQLAACASSNQVRAEQLGLWLYLFKLAGPSADTPADKLLKARVETTFTPVNCMKAYP